MSKFKIEIQITLLSIFIGVAVVTSGYFAYKSITEIVNSIHREAVPNNQLFMIKDLSADLATLENNARLYILTEEKKDLGPYNEIQQKIISKIKTLQNLPVESNEESVLTDSICSLAQSKMELWQQILILHQSAIGIEPEFTEIYSRLGEVTLDTIQTETETKEKSFLFFKRKKTIIDTTIVERQPDKGEILQDIQDLENEIKSKGEEINILESQLIEKNLVLVQKINKIIAVADQKENDNLLTKTEDANQLAEITYQRLAAFSIAAVLLLLVALFVLFNYLRKSRKYELALKQAKLQAEKLGAVKEKFVANVTHELRTPVNAIYGLTEQLSHKSLDVSTQEMVSVLSKSATHLKNIVNDTLDFTKIQAGKLKLEKIDFSIADVFNEVLALQKPEAVKKNNVLNFNWEGEKPSALLGDPLRLKQILINLIGNSIKFTQNGEIQLNVNCVEKVNRFYFSMIISDTGIGISKENLKIIFDEYVQIENLKGIKNQGTGLGLSIVKKLVELQKGTISIESEQGKGTQVKIGISYPKGKVENISENDFEIVEVPLHFKDLSYLIADDTKYNRFMLKGMLNNWGARYYEASNGNEAVEKAILNKPDVIFMDLRMPEKNGFEAAREILKTNPEITIIAVSASGENNEKKESKNSGMVGFLQKPFSEKELLEILSSTVNKILPEIRTTQMEINLSELERLSNGDPAFLREMILLFITSSENGIQDISEALKKNKMESIRETAHKIASPCKHLHADNLYKKIKNLENLAQEETSSEKLQPVFESVKNDLEEINVLLKNYLDEMPNK